MPKPALLLPFLFIAQLAAGQQRSLFKITVKNKTGYIDSTGTTVIPPIYHNGFDFKEGLAAVRENELYGFIDSSGKYVLAPQFDYATYFVNGITLVYKQRQPYFIDKTGKVILPKAYRSIEFINPRKAVIATKSKRYGIIDIPANRLLLDTQYSRIDFYNSGVAVVRSFDPNSEDYSLKPQGVIDTNGNVIVPFGRYDFINDFYNGFANVILDSISRTPGVIDFTGRLVDKDPSPCTWEAFNSIPYGYATFQKVSPSEQIYEGLINAKGDTILNNPNYKSVSSFSCDRIVVEDHNKNYFILNQHAKPVCNKSFDEIKKFFKNYAIVKEGGCYGIIDTTGKFIIQPTYEDIAFPDSTVDHFYFGVIDKENLYSRRYGLANMNNQVIVQPILSCPEEKGFVNGLFNTMINYQSTYINQQGKIVWQEPIDTQTTIPLNIDYLGHSQYRDYPEALIKLNNGDSAYVELQGKRITAADHLPNNKFIFQFDTTQGFSSNGFKTFKLIVGNSTNEAIKLMRISGLIILKEALDEDGVWKKIEIIGFPSHTNGYDDIILNPGVFWPFTVAQYAGSFPTKLRAALWYLDKNEKIHTIYSNVINTNINRTQFWREYDYPEGVSDPHRWNKSIDLSTIKRDDYGQWSLP